MMIPPTHFFLAKRILETRGGIFKKDDSLIWPIAIRPFAIRSGEGKGAGFPIEQPSPRLAAVQ
jgi:hypothetical protein